MNKALSITESDFCAGVGIQADLKTMMMNGVFYRKHSRCQHRQNKQFVSYNLSF